MFDFCDLPATKEEVTAIVSRHNFRRMKARRQHSDRRVTAPVDYYRKGKVGSWQEELRPFERYVFDEIAGDLLRELGYANDNWWVQSWFQKPTLPLFFRFLKVGRVLKRTIVEGHKAILGTRGSAITSEPNT